MKLRIARTGALDPDDLLGHAAVRRAANLARLHHRFELKAVHHVWEAPATILGQIGHIVEIVAGGQNHSPDVERILAARDRHPKVAHVPFEPCHLRAGENLDVGVAGDRLDALLQQTASVLQVEVEVGELAHPSAQMV